MKIQQGFTLVEITVVLIIIGLLIGSILKGQQLILDAKIKNLEGNYSSLVKALYTYQDRYKALPGDDSGANRFSLPEDGKPLPKGDGNGVIDGDYKNKIGDPLIEPALVWQHLRAAELIMGSSSDGAHPSNVFGGEIGMGMSGYGNSWVYIGFTQIPKEVCMIFEERIDGHPPYPDKGRVKVEKGGAMSYGSDEDKVLNLLFSL